MGDSTRPIKKTGRFAIKTSNYSDNLSSSLSTYEWVKWFNTDVDPLG